LWIFLKDFYIFELDYTKIINMKKQLISIGILLIMAFVVVLFINATESKKDTKKAKTETVVPCPADCNHSTGVKTAVCDPEKCKEVNCTHKDGKCNPATCPAHREGQPKEGHMCGSSTACKGMCHTGTAASK
jgi:hypothetical protein